MNDQNKSQPTQAGVYIYAIPYPFNAPYFTAPDTTGDRLIRPESEREQPTSPASQDQSDTTHTQP